LLRWTFVAGRDNDERGSVRVLSAAGLARDPASASTRLVHPKAERVIKNGSGTLAAPFPFFFHRNPTICLEQLP
jgi:hypothetical protein